METKWCACGDELLIPQEKAAGKCMVCMCLEQQDKEVEEDGQ